MRGPLTQSSEELEKLFAAGRRRSFQPGDVILTEGQAADSLHLVVRGRVRVTVTSPSGNLATLAVLVPGEIFGEQVLASPSASQSVTVTAVQATETLALRAADLERLRAEDASLSDPLLATLAARVRALSDNVVELLYLPAESRVLRRVVELSRAFGDGSRGTVIPLTQEDIAALAGVARGTANRVLREAESGGLLRLGRARVTLLDPGGLAIQAGIEDRSARGFPPVQAPAARPTRQPQPTGGLERRVVSLLLAELLLSGAGLEPEAVRELEAAFRSVSAAALEAFGGKLQSRAGMAAMGVFGAPVARREDPEHAVRAGLRLLEDVAALSMTGLAIGVRVGIETGMALVPTTETSREPLASGQVVGIAWRLLAQAPPGSIVVGPQTYRATHRLIRYEPMKPIVVEPGGEALEAWRALEPIPDQDLPEPGTRMVGRESELGLLQAIWRQVREERRAHLVTVVGDPGIGKSRLAREFTRQVEAQGIRPLFGRSLPYGGRTGYGPVGQQLKSLAGISDSDPADDARQRLDRLAAELLGADASNVGEHIALLVGLGEEGPADRQALFFSVRRVVEAMARANPSLLVFEDLHWADPTQLDLLNWLVSRVRDAPVLFLALARPELFERMPVWSAGLSGQTTLRLEPLSPESGRRLLGQLLPSGEEVASRLAERAEGNPLFIEELAASVIEGVSWELGRLPATVMVTIASRLDALPAPARQVLRAASVVGRWFWRGALGVHMAGEELDAALDFLDARGIIVREATSRFATEPEYRFKHILIREVAYDMIPRPARQERHAAVARFLERVTRERAAEWASVLAYHWREAGNREKAVAQLQLAAGLAGRGWAKGEAVALYTQALELLDDDDSRRGRIRLNRALAMMDLGDYRAAVAELDALIPELEPRPQLEAVIARGDASEWIADPEGIQLHARRALELAASLGDPELEGPALALMARARSAVGDNFVSLDVAERALGVWRPGVRPAELALHLEMTGLRNYWLDQYERSEQLERQAQQLAQELYSVRGVLRAGATLGLALAGRGRMEESLEAFAQVAATARELEFQPRWWARALNMWAGVLRELQDFEEARRLNEEGVELAARADFNMGHLQGSIDFLYLALATGDVGAAERAWPRLWEEAQASTMVHRWVMSGRLLTAKAQIELVLDRPDEAAATAAGAVEEHRARGRTRYEVISRLALGSALLRLSQRPRGLAELTEALAAAERIRHAPSIWRAAHALGRALVSRDEKAAEASLARARAAVLSVADSLAPERRAKFITAHAIAEVFATV